MLAKPKQVASSQAGSDLASVASAAQSRAISDPVESPGRVDSNVTAAGILSPARCLRVLAGADSHGGPMPGAYSEDLRSRVIDAATNGGSIRAAARRFKVSASSAIKWMQQFRETGSAVAKPTGGDRRSQRIGEHAEWLLALAAAEPDLTLIGVKPSQRLISPTGFSRYLHLYIPLRPKVAMARLSQPG